MMVRHPPSEPRPDNLQRYTDTESEQDSLMGQRIGVGDWEMHTDPDGYVYYWNQTTNNSSWDPPPGFTPTYLKNQQPPQETQELEQDDSKVNETEDIEVVAVDEAVEVDQPVEETDFNQPEVAYPEVDQPEIDQPVQEDTVEPSEVTEVVSAEQNVDNEYYDNDYASTEVLEATSEDVETVSTSATNDYDRGDTDVKPYPAEQPNDDDDNADDVNNNDNEDYNYQPKPQPQPQPQSPPQKYPRKTSRMSLGRVDENQPLHSTATADDVENKDDDNLDRIVEEIERKYEQQKTERGDSDDDEEDVPLEDLSRVNTMQMVEMERAIDRARLLAEAEKAANMEKAESNYDFYERLSRSSTYVLRFVVLLCVCPVFFSLSSLMAVLLQHSTYYSVTTFVLWFAWLRSYAKVKSIALLVRLQRFARHSLAKLRMAKERAAAKAQEQEGLREEGRRALAKEEVERILNQDR